MRSDSTTHLEVQQPYYRLGTDNANRWRRKSNLFRFFNALLSGLLIVFGLLLIFNLLRPTRRDCSFPRPGSRCFWPFQHPHMVLLISMDGFRHDYLEIVRSRLGPDSLPNFARLEAEGVRANRSINAFPTITMPNHHTLVTGLYPEDSGVVGNNIFDSNWPNKTFEMGNQESLNEDPWLVGWPDPIWVTLQRKGGLAGSLLWPLTDNFVRQDLPFQQVSQFTQLDSSVRYSYKQRVKDILWWLRNPRYRLDLVMAYFDEPDETGHAYGPNSSQVADVVSQLDKTLGQLLDGLEAKGIRDDVDIILTADHGMSALSHDRVIALDQFVDPDDYSYTQLSTMGFIYPKEGKEEQIYTKLVSCHDRMKVYKLSETPLSLHFNHSNSRMPPIVLVPDPLWSLVHNRNDSLAAGNHGYSPEFSEMSPIFIASGPSFLANKVVDRVHAVDVYALMCSLMHIRANPNNGSLERIAKTLLKPEAADRVLRFDTWPQWFLFLALELEFLWLLMYLSILSVMGLVLGLSLRMQNKYTQLALHTQDDFDGKNPSA